MPTIGIVIIAAAGIVVALEFYAALRFKADQKIWKKLQERYHG